jgi:hypothetical protein
LELAAAGGDVKQIFHLEDETTIESIKVEIEQW